MDNSIRIALTALGASALALVAFADKPLDPKGLGFDPFPDYASLPSRETCPAGGVFAVAPDGSLSIDGKPRYLTATIWYGHTELECREDTPGYVDELKWLYMNMPDYQAMQRLGLDGGGIEAPLAWMKRKYRPGMKDENRDNAQLARCYASGLPMYVDFTAAEWGHGSMWAHDNPLDPKSGVKVAAGAKTGDPGCLPVEAWTKGHHHWMPYSIVEPHGRDVWLTMWREGAKDCIGMTWGKTTGEGKDRKTEQIAMGVKPWCYEFLNEPAPAVFDDGYTQKAFREYLAKSGRSLAEGSVAWKVEYVKFVEGHFASLLSEGAKTIREVDPAARTCFQPCTIRTLGIDLYRANRDLSVICSATGGRGIMEAAMYRGMGDGKPIVDSEMYVGCDKWSIHNAFLDQYQRGFNVSYMFKWSRRPSDWRAVAPVVQTEGRWKGMKLWQMIPEESLKRVGKVSAYNFMCPYKVRTDELVGIRLAKRDILDVNEFFTPRDRGTPRKVAVLFSTPTEHLQQVAGHGSSKMFDQAVTGLELAHLNPDVLFEEQLVDEPHRIERYKVLVTAGTDATYPATCPALRKWVEKKGGVMVCFGEGLQFDEYGEANPKAFPGIATDDRIDSETSVIDFLGTKVNGSAYRNGSPDATWNEIASIGGRPVAWYKKFGLGAVYYVNAKLSSESMARIVKSVGMQLDVKPMCETKDALSGDKPLYDIEVHDARRGNLAAWIVTSRSLSPSVVKFRPAKSVPAMVRVWNELDDREVAGKDPRFRDVIARRQPLQADKDGNYILKLDPGRAVLLVGGSAAELKARYPEASDAKWLPGLTAAQALADGRKAIEEERARRLAAKPAFAVEPNRTRQLDLAKFANARFSENEKQIGEAPEWNLGTYDGVPMNIIRYDQNSYKDCVVIKAGQKVADVAVDQRAGALYFLQCGQSQILVKYGDGTVVKASGAPEKKGLAVWQWKNPNPEKNIVSVSVAPSAKALLLAAITAEKPAAKVYSVDANGGLRSLGGSKGVMQNVKDGVWNIILDDTAASWCTSTCDFKQAIPVEGGKYARMVFEVNRLPDQWGNYHDHATPQFKLNGRDESGKLVFGNWQVARHPGGSWFYRADNDPETWQTAYIDMKGFCPAHFKRVQSIALQFQQMPAEHSGLAIRNIRFEESD